MRVYDREKQKFGLFDMERSIKNVERHINKAKYKATFLYIFLLPIPP